jgi:hypothetical protein
MDNQPAKTIQVQLSLRVQDNSKFGRGKSKAITFIERLVLSNYLMEKLYKNGEEYRLTLKYREDKELDDLIHEMLSEASTIANDYNCFIEADVTALDGSGRYW